MTSIYSKAVVLISKKAKNIVSAMRHCIDLFMLKSVSQLETIHAYSTNSYKITPERVVSNYIHGFVLFGRDSESSLYWKSYPQRGIITVENSRIPKNITKALNKNSFEIKYNHDFLEIIENCRRDKWTWINEPLLDIYGELKTMDYTLSLGAYKNGELVGGIWGLKAGGTFGIMSMFHTDSSAGNILFGSLIKNLQEGSIKMIDCGVINNHFKRFGAAEIDKENFVEFTVRYLNHRIDIQ